MGFEPFEPHWASETCLSDLSHFRDIGNHSSDEKAHTHKENKTKQNHTKKPYWKIKESISTEFSVWSSSVLPSPFPGLSNMPTSSRRCEKIHSYFCELAHGSRSKGGRSPLTPHFGRKVEAHFPANSRYTVITWNISRAVAEEFVTSLHMASSPQAKGLYKSPANTTMHTLLLLSEIFSLN